MVTVYHSPLRKIKKGDGEILLTFLCSYNIIRLYPQKKEGKYWVSKKAQS